MSGLQGMDSAIGAIVGTIGNLVGTGMTNRANRKLAREMWTKNAEYNAPQAQMARLRIAGLNPNLVYGNGADATVSPPSVPEMKAPDISGGIRDYFAMRNQSSQNDLIEKQKEYYDAQIADVKSQTNTRDTATLPKILADITNSNLSAHQKQQLIDTYQEEWSVNMQQKRQNIQNSVSQNHLLQEQIKYYGPQLQQSIRESVARMRQLDVNTQKQQIESELIRLAKDMRKNGVETHDNALLRQFHEVVGWSKRQWEELLKASKWKF